MQTHNLVTGVLLLALGAQVNAFSAEEDPFAGQTLTATTTLSGKQDLVQQLRSQIDHTRDYWLNRHSDEELMHSHGDFYVPLYCLAKQISEANAILGRQDDEVNAMIALMEEADLLSRKAQPTAEETETLQRARLQVNNLLKKAEEMIDILNAE